MQKKAIRALGNAKQAPKNNKKVVNDVVVNHEPKHKHDVGVLQLNADLVLDPAKIDAEHEPIGKPTVDEVESPETQPQQQQQQDEGRLDELEFRSPPIVDGQLHEFAPKIVVAGVGGAGGNAINNMIAKDLQGR